MPRIAPTDWRTLEKIFEADGWKFRRQKGDHRSYIKPGYLRPVVIPMYSEIGIDIIMANMRTAKMSRERYLTLLCDS
jgi:predicted RNA binding protein YcfA (HicA-like mRNA interferase family)